MRILGLESSCDETAAAVVEDGADAAFERRRLAGRNRQSCTAAWCRRSPRARYGGRLRRDAERALEKAGLTLAGHRRRRRHG